MPTFYADSAGGQGTGDGSSPANAATLKECIENDGGLHTALTAGSVIYCKTGSEITFDGSAGPFATTGVVGAVGTPIKVLAYTTTPGDNTGVVEIRDTDSGATNDALVIDDDYWWFSGFKFTDCRSAIYVVSGADGLLLHNIEAVDAASHGFEYGGSTGAGSHFIQCFAHGCGGSGFYTSARSNRFSNCVAIDNAGVGFDLRNGAYGSTLVNCLSYDNDGVGILVQTESTLINCSVLGNGSAGVTSTGSASPHVLVNCLIAGNTYALSASVSGLPFVLINCNIHPADYENTSGDLHTSVASSAIQINPQTGNAALRDTSPDDPEDIDAALGNGSACLGAGAKLGGDGFTGTNTFVDLGAAQRRPGGTPIALL